MKRFWLCCAILALLFAASLANTWYVGNVSDQICARLEQAEQAAASGDWVQARALTETAQACWEAHQDCLSITLSLCDTDDVSTGFQEVLGFLQWQATPEYDGANSTLIAYVEHLAETEQLSWKNLL